MEPHFDASRPASDAFLFHRKIDRALSVSCLNIAMISLSFLSEYSFARGLYTCSKRAYNVNPPLNDDEMPINIRDMSEHCER